MFSEVFSQRLANGRGKTPLSIPALNVHNRRSLGKMDVSSIS